MCLGYSIMQKVNINLLQCGETGLHTSFALYGYMHSYSYEFAAWFAGRLTCDSKKVSNLSKLREL